MISENAKKKTKRIFYKPSTLQKEMQREDSKLFFYLNAKANKKYE